MRDPARIPRILELVRQYWEKSPDLRLGQLMQQMANPPDLWILEDDLLEQRLRTELARLPGDT